MAVRPAKDKKTGKIKPGYYVIDYYPFGSNGERSMREYKVSEAEAYALEKEFRRTSRKMPHSVNPKVYEILPDFQAYCKNEYLPNTFRDLKSCLVSLTKFFETCYMSELCPMLIEAYKTDRLASVKKRTINKELSYFSKFLGWADDQGHWKTDFKVKKFPAKQTKPDKPRIPTREEINDMIAAIEQKYRLIMLLLYDGGLRRSEALNLKGEDVNLRSGIIYVRGKGDKERILPITTDRLREELESCWKPGYLSVNPKETKKHGKERPYHGIRKALARAAEEAGISQRVYHHLLRHSFGTHTMAAGVNLRAIQGMMGHSTSQVTETYTHLVEDYMVAEAARINAAVKQSLTRVVNETDGKLPKPKEKPD